VRGQHDSKFMGVLPLICVCMSKPASASQVAVYGQQQNSKYMRVVTLICVCVSTLASIFSMLRRKSPGPQAELSETRQPLSRINSA